MPVFCTIVLFLLFIFLYFFVFHTHKYSNQLFDSQKRHSLKWHRLLRFSGALRYTYSNTPSVYTLTGNARIQMKQSLCCYDGLAAYRGSNSTDPHCQVYKYTRYGIWGLYTTGSFDRRFYGYSAARGRANGTTGPTRLGPHRFQACVSIGANTRRLFL